MNHNTYIYWRFLTFSIVYGVSLFVAFVLLSIGMAYFDYTVQSTSVAIAGTVISSNKIFMILISTCIGTALGFKKIMQPANKVKYRN